MKGGYTLIFSCVHQFLKFVTIYTQCNNAKHTQCNRTRAVELFSEGVVSLVNQLQTVVAVLGGGCSSATEEIATASNGSLPLVRTGVNVLFRVANEVLRSHFPSVYKIDTYTMHNHNHRS